ncbi:DUF2961 domain-containing protein [candidate division KSB1 bacterium]|nr:DUF2961 domain-containing protein [candidate division KSB1 bacterium]RQW05423.1 MAG: DUF2961 domain-containing protein [candidate division KSB1 bacterium]
MIFHLCVITFFFLGCAEQQLDEFNSLDKPYVYTDNLTPVWTSFENSTGEKGVGGMENNGAKGHPYERFRAGETKTLLDLQGPGIINRMWVTLQPRAPYVLRGLVIKMYWDHEEKPAVSVPFGDFFGVGLSRTVAFENALFANPEGRSFVSYVHMPYKKAARIEVVNEMNFDVPMLFYDVDAQRLKKWHDDYLYFHAYWHRDQATELAKDFEILPMIKGKGRFLGTNISIHANPAYKDYWWGEGEVKVYFDSDDEFPSLVGTGTEDYIGTGWGQGQYFHRYQGCSIADGANKQWSYYRYHIPDPITFKTDCKVTIQQMGGTSKRNVLEMLKNNVPLIPVTINGDESKLIHLYEKGTITDLTNPDLPGDEAWTNFFRSDDVAAVAYFYLDKPVNELPEIQDITIRTAEVR